MYSEIRHRYNQARFLKLAGLKEGGGRITRAQGPQLPYGVPRGKDTRAEGHRGPAPTTRLLSPSSYSAPWVKQKNNLPLAFQKNFLSWTLSSQTAAGPPAPLNDLALRNSLTHYT